MRKSSPRRSNKVSPEDVPGVKLKKSDKNHMSPESAPAPVGLVTVAAKENTTISGDCGLAYEFHFDSRHSYFHGIVTSGGKPKDVSFVPFDEAKGNQIYDSYIHNGNYDERVLKPHFITYCQPISKYIICYDRFDDSLKDWLRKWFTSNDVKDSNGLPHPVIKTEISKLLKCVNNFHNKGLLHLSLSDISNYVVINDNWYIINISGKKSDSKLKSAIISDFRGFRDMLKNNVLTDTSWQERNDFVNAFDVNIPPNRLVTILVDHVFTKSSCERLQMYSVVRRGWRDPKSHKFSMLSNAFSKGSFDPFIKGGWDKVPMSTVLSDIYKYPGSHYNGHRMGSLLNFLGNVEQHYDQHNGNVVDVEKEVRKLWPGLLEKLLQYD